jgi:hypothetical protein
MSVTNAFRVLVAPLDWGLGHATRCIPVIRALQAQGAEVILYASPSLLNFLRIHFPALEQIQSNEVPVRYSARLPAWLKILFQANKFSRNVQKEYTHVQSIIRTHQIHAIISDNRYGVKSDAVPSVLITHQLQPLPPAFLTIFSFLLRRKMEQYFQGFSEIWIPDLDAGDSFSGMLSLSARTAEKQRRIGILSRFSAPVSEQSRHGILAVLSGPEPQRSILFQQILRINTQILPDISIIIDKMPEKVSSDDLKKTRIILCPDDETFLAEIASAHYLICRSGYSSLMDLIRLNRTALFVPTPGQTEQEYLAVHAKEFGFKACAQDDLRHIKSKEEFEALFPQQENLSKTISQEQGRSEALLKDAIQHLIRK